MPTVGEIMAFVLGACAGAVLLALKLTLFATAVHEDDERRAEENE